ncbi:MAG: uroporphyrinogen-III C-methyltransferase [Rhodospirillales bacterium]|nr:uroporphyrinogen-III C-methyltransferase [Rhodospirillales bacterium]
MTRPGKVHLVGAGPGDPDLLTVKAERLIRAADVVVYDRLVGEGVLGLIPAGTMRVFVGKESGHHILPQERINDLLLSLARAGRQVVRLKGGDPYIFGRGGEEALFLVRHGVAVEVVPGVSAASGIGALAGIPLTHRGLASSVRFVTGHARENGRLDLDWQGLADPDCTLVIYMGLTTAPTIAAQLIAAGRPAATPVALIENGTTEAERRIIATLADLPQAIERHGLKPPTLILIGKVVGLAAELGAAEDGPAADAVKHG